MHNPSDLLVIVIVALQLAHIPLVGWDVTDGDTVLDPDLQDVTGQHKLLRRGSGIAGRQVDQFREGDLEPEDQEIGLLLCMLATLPISFCQLIVQYLELVQNITTLLKVLCRLGPFLL